jgi:molybdenum cofactor cytidylyltransferase
MAGKQMRRVRPGEVPPDGGTAVQTDPQRPVFSGNGEHDYVCVECGNLLAASMPAEWMNRKLRIRCARCQTVNAAVEEEGVDYAAAFGRPAFAGVGVRRAPPPPAAGIILAAGGSSRLGRPKQLLEYGGGTLLGHVLGIARGSPLQQRICVIGGAAAEVRAAVDLAGFTVVENPDHGEGCGSSVARGLSAVDEGAQVVVLMLGDQPGVLPSTVAALLAGRGNSPVAVCAYDDGRGHPLAFGRELFGELRAMHGDKAVWKLLDRHAAAVAEVRIDGPIPPDIDTWEDYLAARSSGTRIS